MPNRKRHYRVTLADAIKSHSSALRFGGLSGIRREADILSAIGRPYSGYYRSISRKAAALFHSMATNHGFNDGNKRTAILLTFVLIERSGYELKAVEDEDLNRKIADLALHVVNDKPPFDEIVEWFRLRCRSVG